MEQQAEKHKPTLQKLRPKHIAIAQLVAANPTIKQGEIAAHFGMTQTWVSIIMNSDAFKEYLATIDQRVVDDVVIPLRQKLVGVAHRAVEKLGQAVDASQDPEFLLKAADKTLHRLGYAPTKGPEEAPRQLNVQNNYYTVSKEALAQAREKMVQQAQAVYDAPTPQAPQLPPGD